MHARGSRQAHLQTMPVVDVVAVQPASVPRPLVDSCVPWSGPVFLQLLVGQFHRLEPYSRSFALAFSGSVCLLSFGTAQTPQLESALHL